MLGDTAPHACAMVSWNFFIACGYWLYKAEYQNNHDDGCGVPFLLGWVFASRLRPMRKSRKKT
jgi:hypothetical protein